MRCKIQKNPLIMKLFHVLKFFDIIALLVCQHGTILNDRFDFIFLPDEMTRQDQIKIKSNHSCSIHNNV